MSKTLTVKTSKTQIKAAEENKTVKAVSKKVNQINENIDVKIYSVEGKIVETLPLAQQMQEQNINKENIKRAILYEQRLIIQPQGRDPMAGMRCSSEMHTRQRRTYRSKKNKGMTRVARNPFTMEGVQTTNARGGSHRHKPRAEKRVEWTLPKKEYLKAMRAALTLSTRVDEVVARGHKLDKEVKLPIVFDASLFDIKKTKNFVEFLKQAGFEEELARAQNRIIKA
ncbi:MAG: 50S ribosomal protein L4, partial [Euryarchaeota archaeon HGW-Euryarchaeota-1]